MSIATAKATIESGVVGARERRNAGTLLDGLESAVKAAAVADLDQTISASYDQAEVQAISDKVSRTKPRARLMSADSPIMPTMT